MLVVFCMLWDIMMLVWFKVLFNNWINCIMMFIVIGFCLVKGLLYSINFGFRVIVWVNVVWRVIFLDSLLGIRFFVFFSFIVCNFIRIIFWIMFFGSLVCICRGNVIFLKIDRFVNKVLFWNSIFILLWIWNNLFWFSLGILWLLIRMLLLLGFNWLLMRCSKVVLLVLFGFIIVVILFFGIIKLILL